MADFDPTMIPAEPPPPGQVSNLIDPPSQAWMPRVAVYTTLPVAVGFLALRLYARAHLRQKLQWEDYLAITALVGLFRLDSSTVLRIVIWGVAIAVSNWCTQLTSIGFCGVILKTVLDDVYGRHIWDIPLSAVNTTFFQETFAIPLLHSVAALLIKLSLLVLFYRLFSPLKRSKMLIKFGVVFTIVSYTAVLTAWIYYNVPHVGEVGWLDPEFIIRSAITGSKIAIVLGTLGSFTDLYVIAIPLTSVFELSLSTARKIGLAAIFATGLLACSVSLASLVARLAIYRTSMIEGAPSDFHWASMEAYALSVAEINLGIVCACVPVAFPVFKVLAQKLYSMGSSLRRKTETAESSSTAPIHTQGLPHVPRGTLVTLRSIFQNPKSFREEKPQDIIVTRVTEIEMVS